MRTALWLLGLTACAAPGLSDPQIAAALQAIPEHGVVSLGVTGGWIAWIRIPAADVAPAPAERTAAGVQPDGELRLRAREWSAAGAGWRFVKEYPDGQRRSLLVTDDGQVLERTHSLAEVPAELQQALQAAGRGDVEGVDVVQAAPGVEWIRVTQSTPRGRRIVELALDGSVRRVTRSLPAVLRVVDP